MRTRIVLAVVAGLVLLPAVPASAHPGHESCAGGAPAAAPVFGFPQPGPGFGTFIAEIGKSGQAKDVITAFHAAFCEPHAPGE
jgi:hypothetical protein